MNALAHAVLTRLPPETAHSLAVRALALGLGGTQVPDRGPPAYLFGKALPNRVGLSGGADKNAEALAGWARLGFGFVEAGTVTVSPRAGNPRPRVWRIGPDSMVNAMGLPNRGVDAFRANLQAYRSTPEGRSRCVGASVASPDGKPGEMRLLGERIGPLVDFLTLNASCPNTEHEPLRADGVLAQVAELRDGAGNVPILVKLGPTEAPQALDRMVEAMAGAGVDGFVACNTATAAMRPALRRAAPGSWPGRDGQPVGGYSGPGLAAISLRMVERIRRLVGPGPTVIGVGGVQEPADLTAMLRAGADAVEVYTVVARRGVPALDALRLTDAEDRTTRRG